MGGEGPTKFLYRIKEDGKDLQKVVQDPVKFLYDVSPDGKWLAAWVGSSVVAYPADGGRPTLICSTCANRGPVVNWSRDGKILYLYDSPAQTYAVSLPPGQMLPPLPASGIRSPGFDAASVLGAKVLPQERAVGGPDPSVYAFIRVTTHRNIYRIPVP